MPQTAKLPLSQEDLDCVGPDGRRHLERVFRFACRYIATKEGAPERCRRKACRQSEKCHLDRDSGGAFTCPGSDLPYMELLAVALFFALADFAHDLMPDPPDSSDPR